MKRNRWRWLAVLVAAVVPSLATAGGNVNIFLGEKELDTNEWGTAFDEQGEFGVLIDFGNEYWPVNFAIDLLGSSKQYNYLDGYEEASTSEIDIGVRKIFDLEGTLVHPYVGGGLALVSARYEDVYYYSSPCYPRYDCGDEDSGLGVWMNAGFYVTLGQSFNLGLDLRYSEADVTLLGTTVNAGGTHAGLLLGYHWW